MGEVILAIGVVLLLVAVVGFAGLLFLWAMGWHDS
jgi:hypothetical protein